MADGKNGMNMVARRSTRVFENDIDVRQIEDSVPDGGIGYSRKGDEKSQERDSTRLTEMLIHTRTSSMSSLVAPPVDGEIITTFQRVSRSDSEEGSSLSVSLINTPQSGKLTYSPVFSSVKGEVAENPKMYGRPRNFGTILPGVYRSGYPESEDYEFLRDLSLRTIV